MELGVQERVLAIEIISTLVYIKRTMVELVLKPAGIPADIYQPLVYKRDDITGRALSKRQIAPLILEQLEKRGGASQILRNLIEIAAHWTSFHLAQDEYEARATVQKAREVLGIIELMEQRETKQREIARKEELSRMERERSDMMRKQSELLLMMFDELAASSDHQKARLSAAGVA